MTLGEARIQRFLATKDVAILATVQADGAPLAMPMWFLHDAASLTMISVEGTHKVRNLRRDARVCVVAEAGSGGGDERDRKSTRLNSSHVSISYAVFCLKKKKIRNRPRACARVFSKRQ